jgi:hypothetical protein
VRPARRVGGDVGRPHAALWATPGHSWAAQATRTARVGRPRGFRPMDGVLNKNPFLFISNSIHIQILEIHLSAQSSKKYESSSVGFVIL